MPDKTSKTKPVTPLPYAAFAREFVDALKKGELVKVALANIVRKEFPVQPTGKEGKKHIDGCRAAALALYMTRSKVTDDDARTKAKNSFKVQWSTAFSDAGIKQLDNEGQIRAKTGGAPKKAKPKVVKGKTEPATTQQLVSALFGHCDPSLLSAVEFAIAHEPSFCRWAEDSAKK